MISFGLEIPIYPLGKLFKKIKLSLAKNGTQPLRDDHESVS